MPETAVPALLAAALVCTVANLVGVGLLAWLSLPLRLARRLARTETLVDDLVAVCGKLEKKAALWDSTMNGIIEEANDAFARVEKKRASAAATVSRGNKLQPAEPQSRAEVISMMRRNAAAGAKAYAEGPKA